MTLQPSERRAVEHGDRYLAAYATVHSLLSDTEPAPSRRESTSVPVLAVSPGIPSARLAHSVGGRRKLKRRRFRAAPDATPAPG